MIKSKKMHIMKKSIINFSILFTCTILVFTLDSCIKDEPLNSEADIISCKLPPEILRREPTISNNDVMIMIINGKANKSKLAPEFTITEGATISPLSGTERDFTKPQTYTVTSQDGKWEKTYTVYVVESDLPVIYSFENWASQNNGKFFIPYEPVYSGDPPIEIERQMIWSSGNAGFAIVGQGLPPEEFPTAPTDDAYTGKYAAKLTTRSTGPLGSTFGMKLAAGNLFLGEFDAGSALSNPLGATKFGTPFNKAPMQFTGYYKYKAGDSYQDKEGNILPNVTDSCSIYSVFYEAGPNGEMLDGSNIQTSERIVAKAIVTNLKQTATYLKFDIEYVYIKEVDPQKLKDFKYNLAVVFTSSHKGAEFSGAIGSVLYVDDVEVVYLDE